MTMNILIVDDSDIIRKMIARTLRLTGLEIGRIHEAGNGREALKLMGEHWIDIVLADINMPIMDGAQMVAAVRAERSIADTPIIVVSTEGSSERLAQLTAQGVAAWVRKPFTPEQIRDVIRDVISTWPSPPVASTVDESLSLVAERFAFVFPDTVAPADLPAPNGPLMLARISFTGAACGQLQLAASEELCSNLAAYMLGEDPGSPASLDRAADALAEFVNMTCGQLTTHIEPDRVTDLTPPEVTRLSHGEWHDILGRPTTRGYDIDGHPMALDVTLRRTRSADMVGAAI